MTRTGIAAGNTSDCPLGVFRAPTRVLTVGPWGQREFAAATADIPASRDWIAVNEISEACDILRNSEQACELLLLAQPLPGQFRQADVDQLQQLVPLARVVIVAGTWCEGELRSGTPPTGTIRLYWYELSSWWQAALRRRDALLCPLWSLPLDHPQAGRCSTEPGAPALAPRVPKILIDASDFVSFETLAAALRAHGMACYHQRSDRTQLPQSRPQGSLPISSSPNGWGGIWDGSQLSKRE